MLHIRFIAFARAQKHIQHNIAIDVHIVLRCGLHPGCFPSVALCSQGRQEEGDKFLYFQNYRADVLVPKSFCITSATVNVLEFSI